MEAEAQALHSPVRPGAGPHPGPANGGTGQDRSGGAAEAENRRAASRTLKDRESVGEKGGEEAKVSPASRAQLSEAVAEANGALRQLDVRLELSVDRATEKVVARVVNDQTGEVIREIPREEVRGLARRLQETGGGALLDTRG